MFDPERTGRFIRFLAYAQKEIARMNAPLPPFNLVSRCPKCGMEGGGPDRQFAGVRVVLHAPDPFPAEYHAGGALPFGRFACGLEMEVEHLHRTCPRCGFGWAEACPQFPDHPAVPDQGAFSHLRPEVAAFALLMERQLAAHDDRPGWKVCSAKYLFQRLREEVAELGGCITNDIVDQPPVNVVGKEAADVANFAMMIADVRGALATGEVKA